MRTFKHLFALSYFFLFLLLTSPLEGQCPTGSVTLTTQASVDAFATDYPNCTELRGGLYIVSSDPNDAINNLNSLQGLTSMEGSLVIENNDSLVSLSGLQNLTRIGEVAAAGDFIIKNNNSLTSLGGLQSLTSVGLSLRIENNESLVSLADLESLTDIGGTGLDIWAGFVKIDNNNSLVSLDGLQGVTALYGLRIENNDNLGSLEELQGLTNLGYLSIKNNDSLVSLDGLHGLTSLWESSLSLEDNNSLINLTDLQNLISMGGSLKIKDNNSLVSLDGLQSLISIGTEQGGSLIIENNNSLLSLDGLQSLTSIAKGFLDLINQFVFGELIIENNDSLLSLDGLQSLTGIDRSLIIKNNSSLVSLAGLQSLTNLSDLKIFENISLQECEIQSICQLLQNGVPATIYANGEGCNDADEILINCSSTSLDVMSDEIDFVLFPNPAKHTVMIEYDGAIPIDQVSIFDLTGKLINRQTPKAGLVDISMLLDGLYFLKFQIGDNSHFQKLIVE